MDLDAITPQLDARYKVLITGHTGFKGAWLTLLLEKLGIEVCGVSLNPDCDSLYSRLGRTGKIQEAFIDIRNYEALSGAVAEFKPNVVFHLAAQPLVLESYAKPLETFETNVMGTVNLLDISFKQSTVELVSVITTDKVYKNLNLGKKFKEEDSLGGKDPYSASKVGTEAAVAAWRQLREHKDGPKLLALRAGNVIGGGDFAEARLLPDLIRGFLSGNAIEIRNPESTRPWQHVLDPLAGYVMASNYVLNGNGADAFNFAPDGESLSVKAVAEIAQKTWGEDSKLEVIPSNASLEAATLQLDSNLAKEVLGWRPKWSQEEAVESTVRWWKKVLQQETSPVDACESDLTEYFSKTNR
jgi:CDP-glucose 4,6-dehydratase